MEKTLIAKRQEKSCSILHTNETEQIKKKKKSVFKSEKQIEVWFKNTDRQNQSKPQKLLLI